CLGEAFHIRRKLRVTAHIHDEVRADVGREYNQRVFEIDRTSLAIFHPPFVKNLEKDLVYVRVRLFDFIKQYHAVWFSAHRLRQPAALSVAYVTWRSPLERGDRMRFLKFAHIYGYYVLFPAIEGFGQREGRLGFADPGWSGQHEDADRFLRIVQFRPGGINALADHLQRMALSDDAPIHDVGQVQHGFYLVFYHPANWNPGRVGDHRGHGLGVGGGQDERPFPLQLL